MKIVRSEQKIPFEAKDGSEIRELLKSESERMSLAEATVHKETKLHFHKTSDEIYYILEGRGVMEIEGERRDCLLYTSPSPRDISGSRMPSSA